MTKLEYDAYVTKIKEFSKWIKSEDVPYLKDIQTFERSEALEEHSYCINRSKMALSIYTKIEKRYCSGDTLVEVVPLISKSQCVKTSRIDRFWNGAITLGYAIKVTKKESEYLYFYEDRSLYEKIKSQLRKSNTIGYNDMSKDLCDKIDRITNEEIKNLNEIISIEVLNEKMSA